MTYASDSVNQVDGVGDELLGEERLSVAEERHQSVVGRLLAKGVDELGGQELVADLGGITREELSTTVDELNGILQEVTVEELLEVVEKTAETSKVEVGEVNVALGKEVLDFGNSSFNFVDNGGGLVGLSLDSKVDSRSGLGKRGADRDGVALLHGSSGNSGGDGSGEQSEDLEETHREIGFLVS